MGLPASPVTPNQLHVARKAREMTATDTMAARKAVEQLKVLGADLTRRGFTTTVVEGGGSPFVNVINRQSSYLSEKVYAAPTGDGSVWFWWSWAERIAPIGHVTTVADRVARVLAPREG